MRLQPTNPMNRAIISVLAFEVIVFGLAVPGMLLVDQVRTPVALASVGVAALLAVAGIAGLRRSWGYPVAWLAQIAGVLLGLLTPMMYAVGGLFALIFLGSFVLGRRIETSPNGRVR
ncbi:DUF4233 domain-containing protein [Aestuariimicrobium ganziense]|uniref:DUF4233 domain-containing protein n=1 Tax=Aestuariimicrobium ganziense TaxID=2773677 RepID=UPI002E2AD29A|nr:DUF4233 domain-containing protein [Aestuariimicrobium ganziense]